MSRAVEYQLSNPKPIDLRKLATKAESQGMYVVESERRGLMYIYNDGEFGIITTSNGMIRLTPHAEEKAADEAEKKKIRKAKDAEALATNTAVKLREKRRREFNA